MNPLARMWARWSVDKAAGADALPRPEALPEGLMLGTVQVQRPVARGATATLYGGIDLASQAAVAVKVLCPTGSPTEAAEARARRAGAGVAWPTRPRARGRRRERRPRG